jgi:hypothetical protein
VSKSQRRPGRRALAFGPGLVFFLAAVGPRDLVSNSVAGNSSLDLRVELFNLFNHTNFDLPIPERMEIFTRDSMREDVGRITSAGKSREIQFGLKLRF